MRGARVGRLDALKCGAPAAVLALAVLLPFLTKAFTVDDVTFLSEAKHLLVDPFHPTAFYMVADGERVRLSDRLVTGPVMAYLLVPSVFLGGAEWIAHAVQAVLLSVSAFATGMLGTRLGLDKARATMAAVFVVVSPAVLGMAATAMPDIAAMSFGVLGMERIVAWKADRRGSTASMAAIFLALATLSRPHLILLFGCAALWLYNKPSPATEKDTSRDRSLVQLMAPLILGLALVGIVIYATRDPASGATVATAAFNRTSISDITFNLTSFALDWVLAFPLAILWPFLRGSDFVRPHRTYATYTLGVALCILVGHLSIVWWLSVLIVLSVCHGLDVLVDIFLDAWRRSDWTQLVLGTWLLIAVPTAMYVHFPSKFLVPSAPAMAILLSRRVRFGRRPLATISLLAGIGVVCVTLGVLIIRADARVAEIGRLGGKIVAQEIAQGKHVWLDGAWGYQWYAEAAGAVPLAQTPPFPRPGDIVVASLRASILRGSALNRTLVYREVFREPGGRIFSDGADFFSNHGGSLLWTWGEGEIGRIEVWRIDTLGPVTP